MQKAKQLQNGRIRLENSNFLVIDVQQQTDQNQCRESGGFMFEFADHGFPRML